MDELLKDYKDTKQIMLKKLKNKENFWKLKEKFIKDYTIEEYNTFYNNLPVFNNLTNVINNIPNPLNTNLNHISNFAGNIGNTLKNTFYNQLNNEDQYTNKTKTTHIEYNPKIEGKESKSYKKIIFLVQLNILKT